MSAPLARVHPTAVIAAEVELAAGVWVGPRCVLEGPVRVGPGCVLAAGACLTGPLALGPGNRVHAGVVLGAPAQHLRHTGPGGGVEIGAGNTFRRGVTVHQATAAAPTRVGSGNRFLAGSHVGHDSVVGDGCVLGANALLGGYCLVGDGVRLGPEAAVHQFCRLGRLAQLGAAAVTTKDVPPYVTQRGHNTVVGVNGAGLRRGGLPLEAVRRLFEIVYRRGLTVPAALAEAERELGEVAAVRAFLDFVRQPGRGINGMRPGV
jgi:UDP-N-acetylglucosamine acyltransferase